MNPVGLALASLRRRFPDVQSVVIAYSGGRDSHVLLHAAKQYAGVSVRALHVAHGMQSAAAHWPDHCAQVCSALEIPLQCLSVDVKTSGQGLEAAAREARYRAFEQNLQPSDLLLLAHHAQDQAETLLLRLLRGTGLRGIGAIPEQRRLGQAFLWRPLLCVAESDIAHYASEQRLQWIEDPSNTSLKHDRNYLRARVLPTLVERWPQTASQLSGAARKAAEAEQLLEELLTPVLDQMINEAGGLNGEKLKLAPSKQQPYLVRFWLARHADQMPTEAQLRVLLREVVGARRDADPKLQLLGGEIRRHRDYLFWVDASAFDCPEPTEWSDRELALNFGVQRLSMSSEFGQQLLIPKGAQVQIRCRCGGERIRLRSGERPLKKVMQDLSVPSWQRDSTPLLYVDGELAAIWNYLIAPKFKKI
ncbi:MAG: tRNA lysidine(34) synthetase TilS [Granulosicoccaceae bacterium]